MSGLPSPPKASRLVGRCKYLASNAPSVSSVTARRSRVNMSGSCRRRTGASKSSIPPAMEPVSSKGTGTSAASANTLTGLLVRFFNPRTIVSPR